MLGQVLAISLGASIGANLRYFGGLWIRDFSKDGFPWPTLSINLLGSLVIGFVAFTATRNDWPEVWKLFLIVGLLGGFTTFSAFSQENLSLIQDGKWLPMLSYTLVSVGGGLALAWIGSAFAQQG